MIALLSEKKTRFHACMRQTVGRITRLRRLRHGQHYRLSLFCQRIAIKVTVRHELKTMGNTGRRIFSVVRNKQQLRFTFANQHINKTADKLAIERIKPCSGSSRISNVGCFTSARTISARRCCPRERLWKGASAVRLSMPRISSHCCTSFAGDPKRPDKCQSNQNSQKESHYAQ